MQTCRRCPPCALTAINNYPQLAYSSILICAVQSKVQQENSLTAANVQLEDQLQQSDSKTAALREALQYANQEQASTELQAMHREFTGKQLGLKHAAILKVATHSISFWLNLILIHFCRLPLAASGCMVH